jgi:hypothetical protein
MTDLIPTIDTNAAAPKSASQDGTSASQHPLTEQIAADKYTKSAAALQNRPLGIRYVGVRGPAASDIYRDC